MSKIDGQNFIRPHESISPDDPEWKVAANLTREDLRARWQTEQGQALLGKLKASRLDRAVLEQNVGFFADHFDLRGIDLSGMDLSNCDLSRIDFFAANLSRVNFTAADLRDTYLSECDIRGARFDWAKMDGTLVDNVRFDHDTRFHGVNLNAINFTLANLLREAALEQQRIEDLKRYHPILAFILSITSNFGRSISRFILTCAIIIIVFSIAYVALFQKTFTAALQTSVLAFLGIAIPDGSLWIITTIEAFIGYFMLALLAAILVRKTMGP